MSILLTECNELNLINQIIGKPTVYAKEDEPWLADGEYTELDDYGRQWLQN